jgi:hypothetical protein
LARSAAVVVLGYLALFLLLQAHTLWSRPIGDPAAPRGTAFLFSPAWLQTPRDAPLGLLHSGLYLLLIGALFLGYLGALRQARQPDAFGPGAERGGLLLIGGVTGLALFLLLLVPGTFSADLHSYIWYGRILALYGASPFTHSPAEYAARDAEGWLDLVYWPDTPAVYGPVWVGLAGGVAWLAQSLGGAISLHLVGHRLVAALAHLLNVGLLWHVTGQLLARNPPSTAGPGAGGADGGRAGARLAVTLFYAWNPLALIEFGLNGHNDVLLVTGLLAALALHLAGRWRLAVSVLMLAVLVKVVALAWLLGYLWLLARHPPEAGARPGLGTRLGVVGQGLACSAGIAALAYLPFWEGWATLQPLWSGPAATRFVNSLAALVRIKVPEILHQFAVSGDWQPAARWEVDTLRATLEAPLRGVAAVVTVGGGVLLTARVRTLEDLTRAWGWSGFVYLTIGAVWFWPWYVAWLLVPAALLGPARLQTATLLLSLTSLTLYAIYPRVPPALGALPEWRALVLILPALVYALGSGWHARRNKGAGPGGSPPAADPLPTER